MDEILSATENGLALLFVSTFVAILSGFCSSWLYFHFIKRKEIREMIQLNLEQSQKERTTQETIKWANPVQRAVENLNYRLQNTLEDAGYLALHPGFTHPSWSINYDYMMQSSLYYFGQYFAWIQMLQEDLNIEIFHSHKERDEFFTAITDVASTLNSYPPLFDCTGKDVQVFSVQQRAIGESMILREGGQKRCMNYVEFLNRIEEDDFRKHFDPLIALLESIDPSQDCKWKRLWSLRNSLIQLNQICEKRLSPHQDYDHTVKDSSV